MKNNISEYLKSNGIKPSLQRIKIYEYLVKNKNHPTVDKVYNDLVKDIPTLSKTTIYNTFKLFMEKKIVTIITIEENETRYDADTNLHGHFKCEVCGEVYDFAIDDILIRKDILKEFEVDERHLYFKGKCKNCL
ncbi:Fur family transcriptional regulator [Sporosalibacterium faouarense]|uniref:Fur family transcriptional regulator n=1 Tax=Sporosalibacterium faouarense TaxID=516123 RepID=UPI00141CBE81|nr:Fur family transcriptional regulator [Sporosalibacterium faouarense]MTI49570.1 transcriptional repressor [Bacillota bacterium]